MRYSIAKLHIALQGRAGQGRARHGFEAWLILTALIDSRLLAEFKEK